MPTSVLYTGSSCESSPSQNVEMMNA